MQLIRTLPLVALSFAIPGVDLLAQADPDRSLDSNTRTWEIPDGVGGLGGVTRTLRFDFNGDLMQDAALVQSTGQVVIMDSVGDSVRRSTS